MIDSLGVTTDWLAARAQASPDAPALIIGERQWTFAELDALVSRFCGRQSAAGVRPGEHVAVLLPNSPAAVASVFALARLGCVLVPLNTRLTAAEIAWQTQRADCAWLIASPGTVAQAGDVPDTVVRLVVATEPDAFERWAGDTPAQHLPPAPEMNAVQAIVFTSGTTGFPKGAMITYANHFWSAIGSAFRLGVHTDDRWLACLPLYHVGGLAVLFRSCLYGTAVILHDGFYPAAVRHSLRNQAATLVSLVPTMLNRLLHENLSATEAPSLRLILLGGAAATADLLAEARAAGLPVAATYGLTEAASQVATLMPTSANDKPGSAGRPLLFTTISIVDDRGLALPAGSAGEIVVSGPTVMAGYYGDGDSTSLAIRNGRLFTGDIGYLNADGDLWVLDRRADLIVSGGENVYPAEVERILRQHPAVALACVVGLPHPDWGQQVAAVVTLRSPGAATAEDLLAHCRRYLAGYKQPRVILFDDALPQTASGKVQRRAVAERLQSQLEGA